MPPARHKPDPLLAAPKPKKDPLKVSSSTSVDLLTELSLAKEKFDSDRHASSTTAIARGPRPVKKTLWSGQNKGVAARNAKDLQMEKLDLVSTDDLARSARSLERKAEIYERLKRTRGKGLTDTQKEDVLVDFETKYLDAALAGEISDLEDDDEGDLMEVTDEFGRTRFVRREAITPESNLKPTNIIYGDYMPTFMPDPDKVWEINNREDKVEHVHYNPNSEIRSRGVGHYTFSEDNEKRAEQMADLNKARDETEVQREAAKKAAELRRAKIEERRKEIAGKKRKREADKFLSGLGLEMGERLLK